MWNRSENQIKIALIRHGATPANREHRYLGSTDEDLSQEGREALLQAKASGIYPKVDVLFSSSMKRCLSTGELLYPGQIPIVISDWREMDFGDFEGKNYQDLKDDPRYQAWIDSNGTLPFPNGESRAQFEKRCRQGFYEMLDQLSDTKPSITVGLLVHGGTIMSIMSHFGGGDYFDYQVPNGAGYLCGLHQEPRQTSLKILRKL